MWTMAKFNKNSKNEDNMRADTFLMSWSGARDKLPSFCLNFLRMCCAVLRTGGLDGESGVSPRSVRTETWRRIQGRKKKKEHSSPFCFVRQVF